MPDRSFIEQLILKVVDKLALGGVVGLGGFLANRALERYRTSQAIREEAAKKRVEIIAPLWEEMHSIRPKITLASIQCLIPTPEEEINRKFHEINNKIDQVIKKVRLQRFWLGAKLFEEHMNHLSNLQKLSSTLKEQIHDFHRKGVSSTNGEKIRDIVEEESRSHLDIDAILKKI